MYDQKLHNGTTPMSRGRNYYTPEEIREIEKKGGRRKSNKKRKSYKKRKTFKKSSNKKRKSYKKRT